MYFIFGTGHCGCQTLAAELSEQTNSTCLHEPQPALIKEASLYRYGKMGAGEVHECLVNTRQEIAGELFYGESNHKFSFLIPVLADTFPRAKYIWLICNGLDMIASIVARQWYAPDGTEHHQFPHASQSWINGRIQGDRCGDVSADQWQRMDEFEKCCWYWSYTNRLIEQDLNIFVSPENYRLVRHEELNAELSSLIEWLGLVRHNTSDMKIRNSAQYQPYDYRQWTTKQKQVFVRWCGPLMDWFYPNWRGETKGFFNESVAGQSDTDDENARLIEEGEKLFAQGDLEGARCCFESVLANDPSNVTVLNNLGVVWWKNGDLSQSLDYLTEALERDLNNRSTLLNLLPVLSSLGERETLIAVYESYLRNHPEDSQIASLLDELVRDDEPIYEAVDKNDKENALAEKEDLQAILKLGEEHYAKGELEAAREAFERVLEVDENCAIAYNNLGTLEWSLNNAELAMEYMTRAFEINPENREITLNCGHIVSELGFVDVATDVYRAYLKCDPEDAEILRRLESLLVPNSGSIPFVDSATQDRPEATEELIKQGEASYRQGDADEARKIFEHPAKPTEKY